MNALILFARAMGRALRCEGTTSRAPTGLACALLLWLVPTVQAQVLPTQAAYDAAYSARRDSLVAALTEAALQKAADAAKSGCPISKLLKAEITMNAVLES